MRSQISALASLTGATLIIATSTALLAADADAALVHRYSFDDLNDSVGDKNLTLVGGATLSGGAMVNADNLSAATRGAQLPTDTLTGFTSVTFEGWFGFHDGDNNQGRRVFYFGGSPGNESIEGGIFNPGNVSGVDWWRLAFVDYQNNAQNGWDSLRIQHNGLGALGANNNFHYMAVTIDDAADTITLYFGKNDGAGGYTFFSNVRTGWTGSLATILPTANYIGTASWGGHLNGKVDEFRIYNQALSLQDIQASLAAGPNTIVPEPASLALLGLGGLLMLPGRGRRTRADRSV